MNEESFGICSILWQEDKTFLLSFDDFEEFEPFPKNINNLMGSDEIAGYELELIVLAVIKLKKIELKEVIFDSESDMFCAYCNNKEPLKVIAIIIEKLLEDKDRLKKFIDIAISIEEQRPSLLAKVNNNGWVKCPKCGWRFKASDKEAWSGKRHIRCGQVLHLE